MPISRLSQPGQLASLLPAGLSAACITEKSQGFTRLTAAAVFLVLLLVFDAFGITSGRLHYGAVVYVLFALLWLFVVGRDLLGRDMRLAVALLADNLILTSCFYFDGQLFPLVLCSPVYAAIGYGLRYGARYAGFSVLASVVFAVPCMLLSPYWHNHGLSAVAWLLSLIILPCYSVRLAENIASAKRDLEVKAASLEVVSRTDSLTGLLNRRGLLSFLAGHLASLPNTTAKSALLYLDLDGFKAVNDVAGHATGDAVLESVARKVASCLRPTDLVSRFGGDEFVAVLNGIASENDSCLVAERILEQIRAIRVADHPELRIGASIGICLLPDERVQAPHDALNLADRMMYQAKQAGKNRVFSLAEVR